jgi:hypothetical protein
MLTHPTIDQLRALRLDGMTRDLAPAKWLALLLDREAAHCGTQRFKAGCAMRSCATAIV